MNPQRDESIVVYSVSKPDETPEAYRQTGVPYQKRIIHFQGLVKNTER